MSFEQLIDKVQQAEHALEASERRVAADVRQFKASWRAAWTPGRIVIAGVATGFLVGRTQPLRRVSGGGVLQMITALSGLFASSTAQAAADDAGDAAQSAEATAAVASGALPPAEGGFRRDGPRLHEPPASGPTAAEAATELSEH